VVTLQFAVLIREGGVELKLVGDVPHLLFCNFRRSMKTKKVEGT
jgi:hypothetical protein